jgi:hypothetical protein
MMDRLSGRKARVDSSILLVIAATLMFWVLIAVLVAKMA